MKTKLTTLKSFVRGDTPLLTFNFFDGANEMNLSGYTAAITITANSSPSSINDAIVKKTQMTIVGNTASYQFTTEVSKQLTPGTTYYGDIELTKLPVETNTFTPVRFQFTVLQDYGV